MGGVADLVLGEDEVHVAHGDRGQDEVQPDLDQATPVKKLKRNLKRNFTYEGVKVSASPPKKPKKIVY